VQTSRLLAKTPKIDYLLGAPPHLSLSKKVLVPSIKALKVLLITAKKLLYAP